MQLKLAADEFVRYLRSSDAVKEFQIAKGQFENDADVKAMRQEYTSLARSYRDKERAGTLSEDDIAKLRSLQKAFNTHPVVVRYVRAQEALVALLRHCNESVSEDLGFDFAATAAAAANC